MSHQSIIFAEINILPMENIQFIPIEERSLNDRLVNLYGSKLPALYAAVKPLFEDPNAVKPALPLLIELNDDESYENADIRVMIFGRETNNWNDKKERSQCPFGTYNFACTSYDDYLNEIRGKHINGEPEIYGICDIYHSYCYENNGVGKTPFTRKQSLLMDMLRGRMEDKSIQCVWNNISKIGCGGKDFGNSCAKPTQEIRDIEQRYFNVIQEEIDILNPDIILFLTGYGADEDIKEKFNITNNDFTPIREGLFLDRLNIPGVKYAARTIHPSRKSNEIVNQHFGALIEDILNSIS